MEDSQRTSSVCGQPDQSREGMSCGLIVEPEVAFCNGQHQNENMKKLQIAILAAALAAAMSASAAVTITVEATMAPNGWGSPSFNTWAANGIYAMENGLTSYGAAGPAQFNVTTSPLPVTANFVTGFPSWMGQADPAAPYNNELGTRASFAAVINGNGSLISISHMGVFGSGTDPGHTLGFDWPENSILTDDWDYDAHHIGIIYNNGVDTSAGFTVVNSGGNPDQLVNEIISIGTGDAFAGYLTDLPPGATGQQVIDADLAGMSGYEFTGTFTYGDPNLNGSYSDSGSATLNFIAVPEPTTMTIIIAGACLLLPFRARALRMLRKNRTV